ncbi:GCN5-related N-acetyltransferase [Alloactinosynnema sp. L-07]|uniref:GNAT family N-acetyltransferase n=1 Tax=Alloactinosynnema sp. L-07 TaxID=1653480 RepID=UPI00065EF3AC|nr:GNAT family N-acetyltransferase [Alloactinosynnema sp. L-07]CRK61675.1 GCN5-related N-acetyltransferase [Alloactinosynnema sp. L-07]
MTLESRCADAWPAQVDKPLGAWRLRANGGYTGRANSTLTLRDPGVPIPSALRVVEAFAEAEGIRPCAHVVVGSPAEPAIAAAGWRVNLDHPKGAESSVLVSSEPMVGPAAAVSDVPPEGWFDLVVGGAPTPAQRHILTSGPRVAYASAMSDGVLAGAARGCLVESVLHVSVVEVVPRFRRQGIARTLLSALDAWAKPKIRVLQVAVHNEPAMALYDSLGYRESHRYRYWIPG